MELWKKLFEALFGDLLKKAPANWTAFQLARVLLNMPQEKIGVDIEHLDYNIKPKAQELLKQFPEIKIVSVLRTFKEQDRLYAQGRTAPGNIVTNAQAGQSYHNYGLAFDFMFPDDPAYQSPRERWERVGRAGEKLGLYWGGNFGDLGHFEYNVVNWKNLINYFKNV